MALFNAKQELKNSKVQNNSEIKVIVTTSINHPTKAISKFDSLKDWKLIVVGDKKTPKNYKLKNGVYLTPKDQELIDKKLSRLIGWNCIERRNFGLIYAKKIKASVVALIDDDNIPYKNWGKSMLAEKQEDLVSNFSSLRPKDTIDESCLYLLNKTEF